VKIAVRTDGDERIGNPRFEIQEDINGGNEAKRSHWSQPTYIQWDTLKTAETKPRCLSSIASNVYGHFDPVSQQVVTDGGSLYIADCDGCDGG